MPPPHLLVQQCPDLFEPKPYSPGDGLTCVTTVEHGVGVSTHLQVQQQLSLEGNEYNQQEGMTAEAYDMCHIPDTGKSGVHGCVCVRQVHGKEDPLPAEGSRHSYNRSRNNP